MATINKLSKLFSALAEQDVGRAQQFASQIVTDEERKGHHSAAKLLKGSLRPNNGRKISGRGNGLHYAAMPWLLTDALAPQDLATRLKDVSLRPSIRAELETITREWKYRMELQSAGVQRRSKLLFFGPPGCGKSLSAKALGSALSIPTYIVRFDGVIGAYLGQTAIHLRELFRFAEHSPCVLLFDEVDALGKRRGNPLDVGELDRIVIAFMQELEHSHPEGLVVATSNLPRELDLALGRRFDLTIEFPRPNKTELKSFVQSIASKYNLRPQLSLIKKAMKSCSYAEAERVVEYEVRKRVLEKVEHAATRNKR